MKVTHPTQYKFVHRGRHPESGRQVVKWASGIGDLIEEHDMHIPVGSVREAFILADQRMEENFLADQGESDILDVYFRAGTAPSGFFFRLFNDTPVETDALTDLINEVTGTGYAAIAVARNTTDWPTLALNSGDYRITSATKTFTATGTWTAATYLVLATTSNNTGRHVASRALGATRTLLNGDTLAVTYNLTLS